MCLHFGRFRVDEAELNKRSYSCNPSICGEDVCCAKFDIAVTIEEQQRINSMVEKLSSFCPWLKETDELFKKTPCEIFIHKQNNGLCLFNYPSPEGGYYCALHSAALQDGVNPFAYKPLNCSMWPFLRDGMNNLELDTGTKAPCLKENIKAESDPNLLELLELIKDNQ